MAKPSLRGNDNMNNNCHFEPRVLGEKSLHKNFAHTLFMLQKKFYKSFIMYFRIPIDFWNFHYHKKKTKLFYSFDEFVIIEKTNRKDHRGYIEHAEILLLINLDFKFFLFFANSAFSLRLCGKKWVVKLFYYSNYRFGNVIAAAEAVAVFNFPRVVGRSYHFRQRRICLRLNYRHLAKGSRDRHHAQAQAVVFSFLSSSAEGSSTFAVTHLSGASCYV